jgi:K+-transporting ATPase KdpF subunit
VRSALTATDTESAMLVLTAFLTVAALVYLVFAMIRPERF